jgi:hypothetical protein
MPKTTESTDLSDQDSTSARPGGTATILDETATSVRAGRLAGRLAGSDLDAETLEMIMAALTAEFCDDANPADA